MKILIAADMEGVTGVTNWDHVTPGHSEYERFRRLMTADVNAAVEGAFHSGAMEVIVTDGHHRGNNLLIEEMDRRVHLNTGSPSPLSMVQGINEDINGVFLIGYHARAGSGHSILDHTWSSSRVAGVWLNERGVGEVGLNAAVCGHFNVPVVMISGDQTVCAEARDLLGPVEVAVVKYASGRMAAECLPPPMTAEKICEAAARAINRLRSGTLADPPVPPPFRPTVPVNLTVQFQQADMADRAELFAGAQRLDGTRLRFLADDMLAAYQAFRAMVTLA